MLKKLVVSVFFMCALSAAQTNHAQDSDSKTARQTTNEGYAIDGSSSASKLRAQRSHSVNQADEIGLSVFFGVIVIGVIVFFATSNQPPK